MGGTFSLELARDGAPVKGVVSFHGNLATQSPAEPGKTKGKVLVCHGAEDPFVPPDVVNAFAEEMTKAGVDWQLISYGGTVHSFTNPTAATVGNPGIAYNKSADERSWQAMRNFFSERGASFRRATRDPESRRHNRRPALNLPGFPLPVEPGTSSAGMTSPFSPLIINMTDSTMTWHYEIKEFYDYADDIEGVNIHYLWTPLGGAPDWDNQRETRFMPLVQPPTYPGDETSIGRTDSAASTAVHLRRKILKLPQQIPAPQSGRSTDRYLLYHYFEIFQDGHRHYSPLYTEEIHTGAGSQPMRVETTDEQKTAAISSLAHGVVKESKK